MPGSVTHAFVSEIPDEPESGRVRPSEWNAEHVVEGLEADLGVPATTSFLSSDNTGVRSWVDAGELAPAEHTHDAADVPYDGTSSGLAADDVQEAIDELVQHTGPTVSGFYRFDTVTTAADPGSGQLRYNHATPASVTALYVDTLSQPGTDATRLFGMLAAGMLLLVQQKNDAARFLQATISGAPTDNGGWWTIPVAVVASGTLPGSGASCNFVVLGGASVATTAADVSYDGTSSGLAADDVQAALDEVKGLLDAGNTVSLSGSYLIAGGGVAWTGGLGFTVSAANYVIQGTAYNSPQTNVTLATADGTNPRLDVIAVNTSSAVQVITGTPAATPERPDVDPATLLEVSFVYVPAAASAVTVGVEQVYRENTEWTTSTSGGTFNVASTSNPFAGTKTIEGTSVANGHYVQFQKAAPFDAATYDSLIFQLRSKGTWPSQKSLTLTLRSSGTQRGSGVVIKHGLFSFDSANTTSYQQIVIPASSFGAAGLSANQLRMEVAGGGAAIGLYIDNVEWQAGVVAPVSSDRMRWRGSYAAATAYSTNDVVLNSDGLQYVALAPGAGFAPATNPTRWQASTGSSSGGVSPVLFWALA